MRIYTPLVVIMAVAFELVLCAPVTASGLYPKNNVIIVGGDHDFPPYEYLDKNGEPAGYNVDLIRAVAEVMGMKIQIRLGPWSQIRTALEKGEIHAIAGLFYSEQRDRFVDFSMPHTIVHHAIFVRKDYEEIKVLEDLMGKEIIVQRGDIMHDYVVEQRLSDHIVLVDDPSSALRLLASGLHDCALLSEGQGLYLAEKFKLTNITITGPPFHPNEYCFAVRSSDKELLGTLNEGLSIIKDTGRYAEIYDTWLGGRPYKGMSPAEVLKWISAMAAIGLFIIAGVGLWSWSMKRQVRLSTQQLSAELAERKRAEENLQKSEERFRSLFENTPVPIWEEDLSEVKAYIDSLKDEYGGDIETYLEEHPDVLSRCIKLVKIVDVNHAALILHNAHDKTHLIESLENIFTPESYGAFRKALAAILAGHTRMELDTVQKTISGDNREVTVNWSVPPGYENKLSRVLISVMDTSESRKIESQLRQAQKMEAIGTLAGGIAHDFNNILSAIIGYTELTMDHVRQDSKSYKNLQGVLGAAERAKNLVNQILTFSRQVEGERKPVKVSLIVKEALKLLRSSIPSTIRIVEHIDRDSGLVTADPTQIHQLIMNLCTNAYQAMEEQGGTMEVILEDTVIDPKSLTIHPQLHTGPYIKLVVRDTGTGIDQAIMDRIFDPFFTTKEKGRGTGLGLATIHGIVTSLGGIILVDSTLNKGTTFSVYLPCTEMDTPSKPILKEKSPRGKGERILLIDDEPSIVQIEKQMLENLGYRITTKTDSMDAYRLFHDQPHSFDLIITDMTMPILTGVALSRKIMQIRSDIPIILCTGFSDKINREKAHEMGIWGYMEKPFIMNDLAVTVRRVLDKAGKTHAPLRVEPS